MVNTNTNFIYKQLHFPSNRHSCFNRFVLFRTHDGTRPGKPKLLF